MLRSTPLAAALVATSLLAAQQPPPPAPAQPPVVTIPAFTGYAHPDPDRMQRPRDGSVPRCDGELVFYVWVANAGELAVALERTANAPATALRVRFDDGQPVDVAAVVEVPHLELGTFPASAGYHRITLATADGAALRNLRALTLTGEAARDLHANTRERRNAASIHLGYPLPADRKDEVEWFYVELTPRTDPLWTYYMATGWHRGYFGMQVNGPDERRLIFSVWDAGSEAKDRARVAAADRVELIAKGEGVVAEGFGNEGTGGHSHLVHGWRLGDTFRFLLQARPDGDTTIYSGWFWFAEQKQWGLIASFRAPKDGKRPHGLYSFSENFSGANGDAARECEFGNAWVRTVEGEWLRLTQARFTHDATGEDVRRDRWAMQRDGRFVLHHGDFTAPPPDAVTKAHAALELANARGEHPRDGELPRLPEVRGEREKNR